ncbi:hypothetical protein ACFSKI_13600 [Pseudogracilibacillus auburnensis]|uniref:ABC-2 family transporter n=1 Tax=Pseudogracilibacillus auburnensis TaxID=1494959 RepID=A0A2V3WE66_9BACI|nr:hypothetical protein [Pseudogracilibacillus auburnensis]PXW90515.1 hypothetical protein DFR56_101427 [Pseudogracilibacillus auburnensis]
MMHLIKTDFKKITYLSGYRNFLIATFLLSILFGITFLFTIDITQGKKLTELSSIEVLDITLLGIDVTAIMLIIFTANLISKEFTTGAIHTSLAITPLRRKYFMSKILFIAILSFLVSITLTCFIFAINQFVLSIYNLDRLPLFEQTLFIKLIGIIIMPIFYSLLSAAGAFYMKSASGGITYALGVMFLPALIKMFPANFSDVTLSIFPEKSLHMFSEINTNSISSSLIYAVLILMLWILISCSLGIRKFKKSNF